MKNELHLYVFLQSYIRWEAYAKHKLDIDGLDTPLKDLDGVLQKRKSSLEMQIMPQSSQTPSQPRIDDSQLSVEQSILILMDESIFPIIRNHLREPEGQVSKALKAYKNCEDVLTKYELSFALPIIRGLLESMFKNDDSFTNLIDLFFQFFYAEALRLCFLEWYEETYSLRVLSIHNVDDCQKVKFHVEVCNEKMQ